MASNTPSNPTRMPSIPTGPRAGAKSSPSKVMSPMGRSSSSKPGKMGVRGASAVNPKADTQTTGKGAR